MGTQVDWGDVQVDWRVMVGVSAEGWPARRAAGGVVVSGWRRRGFVRLFFSGGSVMLCC